MEAVKESTLWFLNKILNSLNSYKTEEDWDGKSRNHLIFFFYSFWYIKIYIEDANCICTEKFQISSTKLDIKRFQNNDEKCNEIFWLLIKPSQSSMINNASWQRQRLGLRI